jgi:hypothetical protein
MGLPARTSTKVLTRLYRRSVLAPQSVKNTKGAPGSTTKPQGERTLEEPANELTVPGASRRPASVVTTRVTRSSARITL